MNENDEHALVVAERLPPDLMLLKMENESIMAVARTAPRDPLKIVAQLQQLIDAYPAAADEAIYRKPVGTVLEVVCAACGIKYEVVKLEQDTVCPACDAPAVQRGKAPQARKVKKFAEGLSIRAAESIRSIYGFTRMATTTETLDDGRAKLTGVLVDYAAGNVTSDERIVTPWYKSRGGQMARTPEDRFLNVVVKAEKARLRRDVILDNTPNIVKAMFRDACEKKLESLVSPEVVEQKILPAFAEFGITAEQLDKIVGRPRKLGWKQTDRLELRKILGALRDGETTVAELLADLDAGAKPAAGQPPAAGATMEDLTRGKPQAEAGAPPPAPTAGNGHKPAADPGVDAPAPAQGQDQQPGQPGPAAAPPPPSESSMAEAEYLELLPHAESLQAVNTLEKGLDKDTRFAGDEPARARVRAACGVKRETIRRGRGERTQQRSMV